MTDLDQLASSEGDGAPPVLDGASNGDPRQKSEAATSLQVPGDDATPGEWQDFYSRIGRPDAPTDYEFKLPDGLAEDFPYDAESARDFAEWAHEAGLTPRQAQSLHDRFVQSLNGQFEAGQQMSAVQLDEVDEAHGALVEAWGAPASQTYQRNVELANRAVRELGGDALAGALQRRGAVTADGEITEPAIAFMLQKAGERLFAEDQVLAGGGSGRNPFATATENITEQGRLLRADPELARTHIRAANREKEFPRLFGGEF